jgi:Zn-dependent protease
VVFVLRSSSLAGLDFGQLLVTFVVLIASLTFHEAAHAWTANRLGDPTARLLGRLSLNPVVHIDPIGTLLFPLIAMVTGAPLIGWAKPVPVDMRNLREPKRDFAIVAIAGPVSNLLLAIGGAALMSAAFGEGAIDALRADDMLATGLFMFILLNVLLAVFNMIPIPPLDGGNVLIGILPAPMAAVIEQLRTYGFVLLYLLLLTGVLGAITRPVQGFILDVLL